MHKPIIQGSVAWQDLYDQGYVVVKKDEYMSHWPTQGWQPIETAPKDGAEVLVWCGGSMFIACMEVGRWFFERTDHSVKPVPTHWMPLPEPPK